MRKLLLPAGLLAMLAVFGLAFAWDSVRVVSAARQRVVLADSEVRLQEERLVALAAAPPVADAALAEALATYRAAQGVAARRAAYESLWIAATAAGGATPAEPSTAARRWLDDTAGAANRRTIADRHYQEELANFRALVQSLRGSLAEQLRSGSSIWDDGR